VISLVGRQHYILKGHNILTSDLGEEYAGIQAKVRGQEVVWGDQSTHSSYERGYSLEDMLNLPALDVKALPLSEGKAFSLIYSTCWAQRFLAGMGRWGYIGITLSKCLVSATPL